MDHVAFAIKAFATLFAATDPVGLIPVFIAITASLTLERKRRIAIEAALASIFLLIAIALAGRLLLLYFGVSIAAFRVVGGILLGKMGFDMLQNVHSAVSHPTFSEQHEHKPTTNIAFTPLAIPMIAGPAAIATIMSLTGDEFEPLRTGITLGAALAAVVICFVAMYFCNWITKWFGPTRMGVVTRLMGFLLLVMAAQMGLEGIRSILLK
jgi:multiple antibiotic resistance protein